MPLVWAHAEFVKLACSRALGRPVDRPARVWARYGGKRPEIDYAIWTFAMRIRRLSAGHSLTIALTAPARIHWGVDNWRETHDIETRDSGLGLHVADLPVAGRSAGETIQFTFFWLDSRTWQGEDYAIAVVAR